MPAAARVEAEIEAAAAVAVGDLDESRGLEAAAEIAVEAQRLGRTEHDTRDRRRGAVAALAAVVLIRGSRDDEIVPRVEVDAGMARAAVQRPALGEFPLGLRVERGAVDGVVLIAFQAANHAVVVDETLAPLVHRVVLGAERQPYARHVGEPAQCAAAIAAIEIDNAAGMRRLVLGGIDRNGEELLHLALTEVEHGLGAAFPEALLVRAAELVLRDGLLGVELDCLRRRLAWVLLELRARQAQRVLRVGLAQAVRHHGEIAVFQLAVEMIARRRAVLAIAVGLEAREVADRVDGAKLPADLERAAPGAVAAAEQVDFRHRRVGSIHRVDHDDAARRIAIERRERPAQHLDALCGAERERRRLPLPVGHRRRDAVRDQSYSPHAEGRARAEAARLDLQVLRIVLAVLHRDARHAPQALG